MKTYDYTDETKDVKGKVKNLNNFSERKNQRNQRITKFTIGVEERNVADHSKPRRGHADDREKHFQTPTQH